MNKKNKKNPAKKTKQVETKTPAVVKKDHVSAKNKQNKKKITLTEKIHLDKSPHSYAGVLKRKYGNISDTMKKPGHVLFKIFIAFFALIFILIITVFVVFGRDLPDVTKLKDMQLSETTVIYDREGHVLYNIFGNENRKYIPLSEMSPNVVHGTIAIEDQHFYGHFGFDIFGIMRAQMKNLKNDDIVQGASTITQQLAKLMFLTPERTYQRKIKELILALQIEWEFSKDEILEMYLNKIAYGSNSHGIEAASHTFFGKPAKELSLVESAVLASLPKAPSYYSPYGQNKKLLMGYCLADEKNDVAPDDATTESTLEQPTEVITKCTSPEDLNYVSGRKDQVLERMVEDKYITKEQAVEAWKQGFNLKFLDPVHKIEAPHFVFYVKELLEQKYGKEMVENGGLEVVTTLDPKLQSVAEELVAKQSELNMKRVRANNAATVALDPKTGQILAMVGSKNYWDASIDGQVNVTTSPRQPGSAFKPLVYAFAIQNAGMGSGTRLGDYKTAFTKTYIPHNSDNTYKGNITIRTAIGASRNIPAIKAYFIGGEEEKLLDFLDKVGVTYLRKFKNAFNEKSNERGWTFNYGPAMAIGSGELPLIELVQGYAVLANNGYKNEINPILEVRDRNGNVLEKFEQKGEQVIDAQAAYIVTSMLTDVSARPAGSWRNSETVAGKTVAAKSGTSDKKVGKVMYPNNLLQLGYTPDIAIGVWVGNTDGSAVRQGAWGIYEAAPIWKGMMEYVTKDKPDVSFTEPEGIIHKGREVYPSYYVSKNFDAKFKRVCDDKDGQQPADSTTTSNVSADPNDPCIQQKKEEGQTTDLTSPIPEISIPKIEYGF